MAVVKSSQHYFSTEESFSFLFVCSSNIGLAFCLFMFFIFIMVVSTGYLLSHNSVYQGLGDGKNSLRSFFCWNLNIRPNGSPLTSLTTKRYPFPFFISPLLHLTQILCCIFVLLNGTFTLTTKRQNIDPYDLLKDFLMQIMLFACVISFIGKLWKLHAWADEGECPAEQESLVRIVDARTIQLQRTGGYLPQRFPRK